MLKLSDLAGASAAIPPEGYLTGYPLQSEPRYVLARTWAAPEMSRPGCVWTHSLLVDFADLSALNSVVDLLALFRRPIGSDLEKYSGAQLVVPSTGRHPSPDEPARWAGVLNALYLHPDSRVLLPAGPSLVDEELVLALWMQQWPRLRRAFRFCTFSTSDRSTNEERFDLQILDGADRARQRAASLLIAVPERIAPELAPALDDLERMGGTGLRTFLRQVAGDVTDGRRAMVPLCRLYDTLHNPAGDIGRAVDVLEEMGTSQATAARTAVVGQALDRLDDLDDRSFEFVTQNVRYMETTLPEPIAYRLGVELWRRKPELLIKELSSANPLGTASAFALASMPLDALLRGVKAVPRFADELLRKRPDMATSPKFWSIPNMDVSSAISILTSESSDARSTIAAIVAAGRTDVAPLVMRAYGLRAVMTAVGDGTDPDPLQWLSTARNNLDELSNALAQMPSLSRRVLLAVARLVDPDALPNVSLGDPWSIAWSRSSGGLPPPDDAYMAAYFVNRALGQRSASPEKLLNDSFERAHQHIANGAMPGDGWRLIDLKLGWLSPRTASERCARLRDVVVDQFIDRGLDPFVFGRLVLDGTLFLALVDTAAKTGKGRRYLGQVRKTLVHDPSAAMRSRAQYIEKAAR